MSTHNPHGHSVGHRLLLDKILRVSFFPPPNDSALRKVFFVVYIWNKNIFWMEYVDEIGEESVIVISWKLKFQN